MRRTTACWAKLGRYPVIALVLIAMIGCNSGATSKNAEAKASEAASGDAAPKTDLQCLADRITTPQEPFHFSYEYSDATRSVDKEADVTLQTMDVTIKDEGGSHSFHGKRDDETSWNGTYLDIWDLSITAVGSRLSSLDGSSAIVSKGKEAMNGYDAKKYAIDTTAAGKSDQSQFTSLFGQGSFEKGTLWVAPDGCPVKLVLDEGMPQTDGNIQKRHYEMARSRKS